ncbi:hypothetical protein NDU88_006493 [Pleurodeles waltl]|uniref:Uncharacterized protein n=1 Tax=Pleurodeles waltl TaxID=8319 RepID=A0AAV7TWZ0_PLEWA|nr:hypothetical protein NDU88_006493 [Pleurodeles waltl]
MIFLSQTGLYSTVTVIKIKRSYQTWYISAPRLLLRSRAPGAQPVMDWTVKVSAPRRQAVPQAFLYIGGTRVLKQPKNKTCAAPAARRGRRLKPERPGLAGAPALETR